MPWEPKGGGVPLTSRHWPGLVQLPCLSWALTPRQRPAHVPAGAELRTCADVSGLHTHHHAVQLSLGKHLTG